MKSKITLLLMGILGLVTPVIVSAQPVIPPDVQPIFDAADAVQPAVFTFLAATAVFSIGIAWAYKPARRRG